MKEEFITVKNENNEIVGKRYVTNKVLAANVHGYIVNGQYLFGIKEYEIMQEYVEDNPDLPVLED